MTLARKSLPLRAFRERPPATLGSTFFLSTVHSSHQRPVSALDSRRFGSLNSPSDNRKPTVSTASIHRSRTSRSVSTAAENTQSPTVLLKVKRSFLIQDDDLHIHLYENDLEPKFKTYDYTGEEYFAYTLFESANRSVENRVYVRQRLDQRKDLWEAKFRLSGSSLNNVCTEVHVTEAEVKKLVGKKVGYPIPMYLPRPWYNLNHKSLLTKREEWRAGDFRIIVDWTQFGDELTNSDWLDSYDCPEDHDGFDWDDCVIGKVQLEKMVAVGTENEKGRKMNRRILSFMKKHKGAFPECEETEHSLDAWLDSARNLFKVSY